jgi:hypothetical protein
MSQASLAIQEQPMVSVPFFDSRKRTLATRAFISRMHLPSDPATLQKLDLPLRA